MGQESGKITTVLTERKMVIKEYYEQPYANKLGNRQNGQSPAKTTYHQNCLKKKQKVWRDV